MTSTASSKKRGLSSKPARLRLDRDTPLLPRIVAESICAEAATWLDDDRPLAFAPTLAARAMRLYACNPAFARRMRAADNEGREWLRAFLRHWLAARLHREHRDLYQRLPSSFSLGASLAPSVRKHAAKRIPDAILTR